MRITNSYIKYVTTQKMPDYPKKDDKNDVSYSGKDKKDSGSPDYSDYDEFGGGGNHYEYSGPDGTYDYDPYH